MKHEHMARNSCLINSQVGEVSYQATASNLTYLMFSFHAEQRRVAKREVMIT